MLNKKGISYVDWVISMGTFVIAVIAILIYLKPGVRPDYNKESLLNIVETNFFNETQWTVRKIPLFIRKLQAPTATQYVGIDLSFSSSKFQLTAQPVTGGIGSASFVSDKVECTNSPCINKTILLVFSPKPNNILTKDFPNAEIGCIPNNDPGFCEAELGSSEIIEGLNNARLTSITSNLTNDYESLKISWKYPLSREFAVYTDNVRITASPEPPPNANVFVKEIKYWKLDNNGVRTPTTVNIRAW